ncbi:MAG: OsmC family protein [Bacteroidota bacterium]
MTDIYRKAGVLWSGDLKNGSGLISTESQVLYEQPFTYATRFEDAPGTNPEELIAAAHAACFSMALASTLKKNGFDPERTDTNATCTLASTPEGHRITAMELHVRGDVPGIDEDTFNRLVMEAHDHCPVSILLRDQIDIKITTALFA